MIPSRNRVLAAVAVGASVLTVAGCELNGVSSRQISGDILRSVEEICGDSREGSRGGVDNIMLMDGRQDDGIATCHDGTNHYFDG
jgi:hypothetical protein